MKKLQITHIKIVPLIAEPLPFLSLPHVTTYHTTDSPITRLPTYVSCEKHLKISRARISMEERIKGKLPTTIEQYRALEQIFFWNNNRWKSGAILVLIIHEKSMYVLDINSNLN